MKNAVLSIIIPTRNRAGDLRGVLESLPSACAGQPDVELLVIDNGSTDTTRAVVDAFAAASPFPVEYLFEPCPGLHVGRNLGAQRARGKILAYLDDDVIVLPGWASAICERFAFDPGVALVGGPCRPLWEQEPPEWLEEFLSREEGGWSIWMLSLLDFGATPRPVSGNNVYGCNFAVRKDVLFDCNGFHPDGMPPSFLHFRGDGETGVGLAVDANPAWSAWYEPNAAVLHKVPAARLTQEYILSIATRAAYSNVFTLYRGRAPGTCSEKLQVLMPLLKDARSRLGMYFRDRLRFAGHSRSRPTRRSVKHRMAFASVWQMLRICCSTELERWVCQKSYFLDDPCPYWQDG